MRRNSTQFNTCRSRRKEALIWFDGARPEKLEPPYVGSYLFWEVE